MKTSKLETIEFPMCYNDCDVVKILGVGECESICPWKFYKARQGKEE